MKKMLPLVIVLLCNCVFAQSPSWEWARSIQSGSYQTISGGNEGFSVVTDLNENVFVAGWFIDTLILSPYNFNYGKGVYCAKYDSSGTLQWAKCGASLLTHQGLGTSITTDRLGNAYFTGWFNGSIVFENDTLNSTSPNDIFLVKYDSSGNLQWAKSVSGTTSETGLKVAVDGNNDVYVAGYFNGQLTFAFDTLVATGSGANALLLKFDSSGNPVWAREGMNGVGTSAEATGVAVDASNNVYLIGYFQGISDTITFGSFPLIGSGSRTLFLTKYNSSGNVLWAKCPQGDHYNNANYVSTDSAGYAYITGNFNSSLLIFGTDTLQNISDASCCFLVKYDSLGNSIWARKISGPWISSYCIATFQNNRIYISGGSYNPQDTILTFDTLTVYYPTGAVDPMYIACYNSSGIIQFVKTLESGADDQNAIAAGASGSVYIAGDFFRVSPFIIGNDPLILVGGSENTFLAKLNYRSTELVNEPSINKQISLFPNPAHNTFTISFSGQLTVESGQLKIYDMTGREVYSEEIVHRTSYIVHQNFSSGIYLVRLEAAEKVYQQKLVIE
jgi:hypothetical protein